MNNNFWDYVFLFLASLLSVLYEMLHKAQDNIKRSTLLMKLIGAILVSFFIVPAIMEYFDLTLKVGLFLTVIIAYGLDELLKATIKKGVSTINKKNDEGI